MHIKITMEMSICQAETGFSWDELVKKVADSYEKKAFSDILKMNLQLTQEVLMYQIFNNKSNLQCCSDAHFTLNGVWAAVSEPVGASLIWFSGEFVVQSAAKHLPRWQSSSVWNVIKPRVMSLKSW